MKPLHVGLLVFGAALAGGLVVRMTMPGPPVGSPAQVSMAAPPATAPPEALVDPPAPADKPAPLPEEETRASADPAASAPDSAKPSPVARATPKPPARPAVQAKPVIQAKPAIQAKKESAPSEPALPAPPAYEPPAQPVDQSPAPPPAAPEPVAAARVEPPSAPEPRPEPRRVTLDSGSSVSIRTIDTISTDRMHGGDVFRGTLAEPLQANGLVIAERGARVTGRVVQSEQAARFGGAALLQLELTDVETSDGQKVRVSTELYSRQGDASGRQDAAKIGGGAALGAIIGAIAGGGKGAAIGAGVGGGAGTAAAAARGKAITIPSETVLRFRLNNRVEITERR